MTEMEIDEKINPNVQCICCLQIKEDKSFLMCKKCRKDMFNFAYDTLKELNVDTRKMKCALKI